jgi:hydrogenase nickel incorporation protein HypA/HybF
MHEASLAKNILEIIEEYSGKFNGKRVKNIKLRVGELLGIYPDALLQYFTEFSRGTRAEGAVLVFENVPIKGKCRECKEEFVLNNFEFNCPKCNESKFDVIGGDEFELTNLEIE